jgi:polyvinyl alcohol dehydrogenase (cytochrome)
MAFELDSSARVWSTQTLAGDVWNVACVAEGDAAANCPEGAGPDYDFGSSTVLVTRRDGSSILLAGQKSGVLYGFDPDNGALLWQREVGAGGVLGGIEWGFAADQRAAYVSVSEAFEQQAGEAGGLMAVDLMDGSVLWEVPPPQGTCANRNFCNTGQPQAVSAIPGVVFSGNLDGHLRAYDARNGDVIWEFDSVREFDTVNGIPAHGGALSGPGATIVDGMVFVSSGYSSFGLMPGNVLLAFALE